MWQVHVGYLGSCAYFPSPVWIDTYIETTTELAPDALKGAESVHRLLIIV